MTVGSSYGTVKDTLTTLLQARAGLANVQVASQEPVVPSDLSKAGYFDAIWVADSDGDYSDECFRALPLAFDETYGLTVMLQSIRATTAGTQNVADIRVDEMLYEVLDTIATSPTLGLGATFNYLFALPAGFRRVTGFMATGAGHGARCELTVEVKCRHTF